MGSDRTDLYKEHVGHSIKLCCMYLKRLRAMVSGIIGKVTIKKMTFWTKNRKEQVVLLRDLGI